MTKSCLKCGKAFDEKTIDDAVMVMNEMRLDMSLPEHRKVLRKYEKVFFGLEKGESELQKNPDKKPEP
jgi:Fe-S cluster biosynthesis and repair protein YggX